MKTTKQQLLTLFLLLATVSISLLPIGGAAFGQLQPPTPQERHQELVEQHQRQQQQQQQQQPPQSTPAAPTAEEPLFTPAPAPTPATANDGSIKGFFLANNGGVDFSINPDDPGGDGDEERPNYALLASIMSASKPSATDQIRAAETNTDIDVGIIRDAAMESLGDLIFFRTYLAFGDTEAARFHSEKISRQMLDAQLEVGFVIPPEQITLIESENPTDEEDLSNSGQRFVELEEREQEAIQEGRLPPNPTYTTLNASDIYELAHSVRGNIGGIAASNMFGDSEEVTFLANQMADRLLKIYYSTNNFAVPLEQVQVIGSTAPTIEELSKQ